MNWWIVFSLCCERIHGGCALVMVFSVVYYLPRCGGKFYYLALLGVLYINGINRVDGNSSDEDKLLVYEAEGPA